MSEHYTASDFVSNWRAGEKVDNRREKLYYRPVELTVRWRMPKMDWDKRWERNAPIRAQVLEVAKVRGAEMSTGNIVSFDVEPMLGMRIIPISKVNV